jgi:predicted RNA-binding Zn ribbon-like protein
METPTHIRRQRIVGGNLALDLINTQNGPAGRPPEDDALRDYADVLAWARYVGALTTRESDRLLRRSRRDPDAADAMFRRTVATRDDLYESFSAVARGSRPPATAIARLQRDEADALTHAELVPGVDGYDWTWPHDDDLGRPLWPVIHAAVTLLTNGPLDRVKGCASCRFHFVDESKNRSRRWCSMDDCGTEDKVRKYVARRASVRSADRAGQGRTPGGRARGSR